VKKRSEERSEARAFTLPLFETDAGTRFIAIQMKQKL
jgi:hypothetical protein